MPEKILVTGFDRFGLQKRRNVSSEVALPAVKEKYSGLVETLVLPTAHNIAAQELISAIQYINPAAVVMFGISSGSRVRLEQTAKNRRMSLAVPDNNGVRTFGRVDKEGAARYNSTLPLDNLYNRLAAAEVPVNMSDDAGTFVCNEVMYKALQHAEGEQHLLPTGFVHLGNGLSDRLVEDAATLVVDELIAYTNSTN